MCLPAEFSVYRNMIDTYTFINLISLIGLQLHHERFCGRGSPGYAEPWVCCQCLQSYHPVGGFMEESGIRQECFFATQ